MAFFCKRCKLLTDYLDLLQLFVPPTFQFGGRQSVPGIYDIVLPNGRQLPLALKVVSDGLVAEAPCVAIGMRVARGVRW